MNMRSPRRQRAYDLTGGRCYYCDQRLADDNAQRGIWMEIDHVVPRIKGGSAAPDNEVPACGSCNSAKGQRTVDEFRALERRRRRDGNYRFAFDPPAPMRDWLMIYSSPGWGARSPTFWRAP